MRRATVLAVVMVLALGGTVQAAPRVPMVTGAYAYQYGAGTSTVLLAARGGDPARGSLAFAGPFGSFRGPVTCVTVIGSDAWVAGEITVGAPEIEGVVYHGWAVRVHDGGTPGRKGDTAITLIDPPEVSLEYCQSADSSVDDWQVPVTGGNLVVQPAR